MTQTITEALAEIKTIGKRLEKKRQSVMQYMARMDQARDPLEKEGGSQEFVRRERQAMRDLEERVVMLRRAIQRANDEEQISVEGKTRSIADWLVWRRDVAPGTKQTLERMRSALDQIRKNTVQKGARMLAEGGEGKPNDVVVNINEKELAAELEEMEQILGTLDGQLSLKNATVLVQE